MPVEQVSTSSRTVAVAVWVRMILAEGTTAPGGSSTVPTIEPYNTWHCTGWAIIISSNSAVDSKPVAVNTV
jgi:hypothetical protein